VNNVNLIGSLTRDPVLEVDANGRDVCAMQVAVQRRGPRGEPEPGVVYVDVVAVGVQARACAEHLAGGMRIGVAGRLERREWITRDGGRAVGWEVRVYQVDLIDVMLPLDR
jgi:single stranded DNA-binding protein